MKRTNRDWEKSHPELMREYSRKWYARNKDDPERKARNRKRTMINKLKRKQEIFSILGNECIRCGITDMRLLQIDHINGGGRKERSAKSNWDIFYKKYMNDKELMKSTFQILCSNCNWIKRYEAGEVKLSQEYIDIFGYTFE